MSAFASHQIDKLRRTAFAKWLASRSSPAIQVSEGWTGDMFLEAVYRDLSRKK